MNIVGDTSWRPDLSGLPGPKYLALHRALRDAIRDGALLSGQRVPTVRDLAWTLGVTPGTVARAYQLALQEGLLTAAVGRGTFVAARVPQLGPTQPLYLDRPPAAAGRLDLRSPILPDVGQSEAFRAALGRLQAQAGFDWIDYPSQRSEADLRTALVDWIGDRVLGAFGPEDLMLTHGGQNAILLILLCCLRHDRPVVLVEDLAYPGFRHAARLARAEVVGVEIDADGIVPDALEAACRKHGAEVLCLTPEAQNPTTVSMSAERRAAVAAIARRYGLQVIEDDCYALAPSDRPAIRALAPERTWHVSSFSKSLSASLRMGFVVCPQGLGEAGRLTAQHAYFAMSRPVSDLVLDLLRSGAADQLRTRLQADCGERLSVARHALSGYDLAWQEGLRFVYLKLPTGWRASSLRARADAEGLLLRSADDYALVNGRAPNAVRIALSGLPSVDELRSGLDRLAALLSRPEQDLMA
jgi:DNA-binding transcriptional MocR family regulator